MTISISISQIFRSWVAIFQPRPPIASLSRSLYDMPGLAPRILRATRLSNKLLEQGYVKESLKSSIQEVLWSIQGSYQTIWSFPLTNVKWHSMTSPYTMTTPYWSDFVPNSTFYRILIGFHRTLRRVWHADRGRLLLRTHGPVTLGLAYVLLVETNPFSELVVIFPDYALRISLGTFSIFHMWPRQSTWSSIRAS